MSIQAECLKERCKNCHHYIWYRNKRFCTKYLDQWKEVNDDDHCSDFKNGMMSFADAVKEIKNRGD